MRLLKIIVLSAAVLIAVAIFAAGPGTKFGLWDYGFGLSIIQKLALPAIAATGLSLIIFVLSLFTNRASAPLAFVALLLAGTASAIPLKMKALADANPFIHDITTDFENPPAIVAGASAERSNPSEYVGSEPAPRSDLTTAEAQRDAFPEIEPVFIPQDVEVVAANARAILTARGMNILADNTDNGVVTIEAVFVSQWFGFADDFVVRISPDGEGSRIDVRSKSRVGISDLGANAARITDFINALDD